MSRASRAACKGLGFDLRSEAHLYTLTEDVVKSSEIEGETLERDQVRSSIARRLGMDVGGLVPADRNVEAVVEMMLDATGNCADPLTEDRLFGWHAALFPAGRSGMRKITVGNWRDDSTGPMQMVSGLIGREKAHYQAPPAARVPAEMKQFLRWFEQPRNTDPLLVPSKARRDQPTRTVPHKARTDAFWNARTFGCSRMRVITTRSSILARVRPDTVA